MPLGSITRLYPDPKRPTLLPLPYQYHLRHNAQAEHTLNL